MGSSDSLDRDIQRSSHLGVHQPFEVTGDLVSCGSLSLHSLNPGGLLTGTQLRLAHRTIANDRHYYYYFYYYCYYSNEKSPMAIGGRSTLFLFSFVLLSLENGGSVSVPVPCALSL